MNTYLLEKKGEILGFCDFLRQKNRRVTAMARTTTQAGSIDYDQFYELLKKFPIDFVRRIIR